jgi:hypothetical protein
MQKKIKYTLDGNEWEAVRWMERNWQVGKDELNQKVLESAAIETAVGPSFLPVFLKIKNAQEHDHQIKMRREADWLVSLGFSAKAAKEEAYDLKVPFVKDWFAVEDPGGYRGVQEEDLDFLSILEVLMGRHGTSMSQFSMSLSPVIEPGFSAFSFSDQLVHVLQLVPIE